VRERFRVRGRADILELKVSWSCLGRMGLCQTAVELEATSHHRITHVRQCARKPRRGQQEKRGGYPAGHVFDISSPSKELKVKSRGPSGAQRLGFSVSRAALRARVRTFV